MYFFWYLDSRYEPDLVIDDASLISVDSAAEIVKCLSRY